MPISRRSILASYIGKMLRLKYNKEIIHYLNYIYDI